MATTFQRSVEAILQAHGLLEAFQNKPDFYAWFEMENYDRLVVEKHHNQVIVGHYFTQNGDRMSDPEIEFDFVTWTPVAIDQQGRYRRKFVDRDGTAYVDVTFHRQVNPLVTMWARNLHAQHWAEHAKASTES